MLTHTVSLLQVIESARGRDDDDGASIMDDFVVSPSPVTPPVRDYGRYRSIKTIEYGSHRLTSVARKKTTFPSKIEQNTASISLPSIQSIISLPSN